MKNCELRPHITDDSSAANRRQRKIPEFIRDAQRFAVFEDFDQIYERRKIMDNKELNMESEKTLLDEENLKDISGGDWKDDVRIPEKVWVQMSSYEKYTYNTLTERTENSLSVPKICG